jgi:predicted nucleic acid-binding protein
MTVYVLDSSALIRYIDNEAGADRVNMAIKACVSGRAGLSISAVQWGEVAGNLRKRLGAVEERRILSNILPSEAEIIPATGERAVRAAALRVDRGLSYADAFAVELALDSTEHILITADYGFQPAADLIQIEFLPTK